MSKNVKFGDSYSGGSRSSRGHVHGHGHGHGHGHRRSDDSGVGSSSDYDSRGSHPDRTFPAADRESQRYNNAALQEALANAIEARDEWKNKAYDLDASLTKKNSELKESEARGRALITHNETLEQEKSLARKENRSLAGENDDLRRQVEELSAKLERANRKIDKLSGTPSPSPTVPHDTSKSRNSVSAAKKQQKERSKEAEREAAAKEKLAQRFLPADQRGDDSDRSGASSNKSHRSPRRQSYVEPMGPAASRPMPVPVPPTNGQYPSYSTTPQYAAAQYSSMQEPAIGRVPRAIRPSVTVYNESATYNEYEDGNYRPYPVPTQSSSISRI